MSDPALAGLPGAAVAVLAECLDRPGFDGCIPAAVVAATECDPGELAQILLPLAARSAFAPTSGYHVGAVLEGASGALYFGANFECPQSALSWTVHAEQAAVLLALRRAERGAVALTVSAPPCGFCREFLLELRSALDLLVCVAGAESWLLADLIPEPFGPMALGKSGQLLGPPVMEVSGLAPQGTPDTEGGLDPLMEAACGAAARSYAPYTGAHAGVALRLRSGELVAAPYIESAAYNPSLSPVLAAARSLASVPAVLGDVVELALAEIEGVQKNPGIRTEHGVLTRAVAAACFPDANVRDRRFSRS